MQPLYRETDGAFSHLDGLEAYTVTLLRFEDQYLLLRRSATKAFAPNRWTGIGGHVEPGEFSKIRAAALREAREEGGFLPEEIAHYALRRVMLVHRPHRPFVVLFYFTGELQQMALPDCPEGTLHWKRKEDFAGLDIIETTRPVLDCLMDDMARDREGNAQPVTGAAVFDQEGVFRRVLWAE